MMTTCERYWQDGILLDERGEHDPHRETCDDCRRAHRERELLIRALPEVGAASPGDPDWQNHVWQRIAREETSRARRSYWLGGALAAAGVLAAIALYLVRDAHPEWIAGDAERSTDRSLDPLRAQIKFVRSQEPIRGYSARVGDRVRISVGPGCEVRVYRADHLVLRCPAWQTSPGCTPGATGLVAEAPLTAAGEYQLVTIASATVDPTGALDRDLASVVDAGGDYRLEDLSVR
jgi:hypothetical protein